MRSLGRDGDPPGGGNPAAARFGRRLSKDYEVKPENSAAWILLVMCHLMVRRLATTPKTQETTRHLIF